MDFLAKILGGMLFNFKKRKVKKASNKNNLGIFKKNLQKIN
jgi:hypothetical protein